MGKQKHPAQPASSKTPTVKPLVWPAVPPPSSPLFFEDWAPGILIADNFFSKKTREAFLKVAQSIPLDPPKPPEKGMAERTGERFVFEDDEFAQRLWRDSGLAQAFEGASSRPGVPGRNGKRAVGLYGTCKIYKYGEGSFFAPHYDDEYQYKGASSEWTLLIYLTGKEDGVVGGETAFYPSPTRKGGNGPAIVPELRAGRALLHRHGQQCTLHEGRKVEKGVKWVLRSDVMFR
ncbi:hypothetical protein JCM8547_000957 [Rhodosporidiobolus lusitaniae]